MAAPESWLNGAVAGWPGQRRLRASAAWPAAARLSAPVEVLPKWLLFTPLTIQWFWLGFRYGSVTLPSVVNPGIETGGLVGESKRACLDMIDRRFAPWVAETAAVPPGADPEAVRRAAGIGYPLIVKPDIGWCGFGVRRIADEAELAAYAAAFPAGETFLLQRLVDAPFEAAVFYVRHPHHVRGRVAALTIRHLPQVSGDGHSPITALIAADPRLRRYADAYAAVLGGAIDRVPAAGETVRLAVIASIRTGGRYEDADHLITAPFETTMDDLCRSMDGFHYGRFDVKFESVEALQEGRFTILEVNGAGAEAIQYWDPRYSFLDTFRGVFAKQRALFAMADDMRRMGHRPIGWRALARAHLRQRRLIKMYPPSN